MTDFSDITISWYPGHMLKATREIKKKLDLIDVVVQVLDSRAPYSSQNQELQELLKHKANVILLSKCDLADKGASAEWKAHFKKTFPETILMHYRQSGLSQTLQELIIRADDKGRKARGSKHPRFRAVRAMIVGIPNVGKSTLINSIAGKKSTQTGPRPGVTRHQQWIKLGEEIELLDTPGIMVPRIEHGERGLKLALIASIKENLLNNALLVEYLLHLYDARGRKEYLTRYDMSEFPGNIEAYLQEVASKTGRLVRGGQVDETKAARSVLTDFWSGKLGRFSLECVSDTE
jgi:ribosome biogenesis GTPase A